ncbi:MAG: TIGR00730 family Rossman fold protein [Gemmatimonadaceae bacterium]
MKALCVFCGSNAGTRPNYTIAAQQFGAAVAQRGVTLVYGGGRIGLMGSLADSALKAGGRVVGVMPKHLVDREVAHHGLTDLHIVASMHERKALMIELSDAFALLPGGFGSWDEFCEAVTWRQLGLHAKPLGILNVLNYYDPLLSLATQSVAEGFVRSSLFEAISIHDDPETLLLSLTR